MLCGRLEVSIDGLVRVSMGTEPEMACAAGSCSVQRMAMPHHISRREIITVGFFSTCKQQLRGGEMRVELTFEFSFSEFICTN